MKTRKAAPAVHCVEEGESLASIADDYGFFEGTLWSLEENESLRESRQRPDVLTARDQVAIPALRQKFILAGTGKTHVFRRRGIPARYRLRVLRDGQSVANAQFTLSVDGGEVRTGKTDADGTLDVPLPPKAREGELCVPSIGMLDPVTLERGVRQRLINLGHLREHTNMTLGEAIASFQQAQGLPVSGMLDDTTRDALEKAHGTRP